MSIKTTNLGREGEAPAKPCFVRAHGSAGASPTPLVRLALESRKRPVWLRVGQLIDGVSADPLRDANVVFDAQQIRFVGSDGETPDRAHLSPGHSEPDAAFPDATLLPTLIEAHAHLFLDGAPVDFQERDSYLKQPVDWMIARARLRWPKILQSGIGAVRDAGDKHGVGLALAAESKVQHSPIPSGLSANSPSAPHTAFPPTPHLDSPGAAIHHRGRYGSFMADPIEDHGSITECVAARVAAGAGRLKLLVGGGI